MCDNPIYMSSEIAPPVPLGNKLTAEETVYRKVLNPLYSSREFKSSSPSPATSIEQLKAVENTSETGVYYATPTSLTAHLTLDKDPGGSYEHIQ